jgi:hypothetical protein
MTALNDDSKFKAPFQYPDHLSLTLITLTLSIITLLFLTRFNRMATDMDSLTAGVDGHLVRLRIGYKGLQKQG